MEPENNIEKRYEFLLKEYAEAGQVMRHYEQLTRTSLTMFLVLATALVGYLLKSSDSATKLGLSASGLVVAMFSLNIVLRLQRYYWCYVERAKEIERLVVVADSQVMRLYSNGAEVRQARCTFSNKTAIAIVLGLAVAFFAVSTVLYGCGYIHS